jgi:hypothetical protein
VPGDPGRPGGEVQHLGVLGVHLLFAGHRADVAEALVVEADRRAIEGERPGRQVDHRPEHPVEVETGGDLSTDLEEEGQVGGAGIAAAARGRRHGGAGQGCQVLEECAVGGVELATRRSSHLDPAGRHSTGLERRRQDGGVGARLGTAGEPAREGAVFGEPDGGVLRPKEGTNPLEHDGKEGVEVERRVERQRALIEEAEMFAPLLQRWIRAGPGHRR